MRLRPFALVVVTSLAVLAPTTAAVADNMTRADATRDVIKASYDEAADDVTVAPAPDRADVDIVRSTVQHRPRKVVTAMTFAASSTKDPRLHVVQVRTNEELVRDVTVATLPGSSRAETAMTTPRGRDVRCKGLSSRFEVAAKRVVGSIPRPCLSRPSWVRVGMGEAAIVGESTVFYDDANVRGGTGDALVLGPRVRR